MALGAVLAPAFVASAQVPAPAPATRPAAKASAPSAATPPGEIPSAIFAKQPVLSGPLLSPDGLKLLAGTTIGGREGVAIFTLATGAYDSLPAPEKGEIAWYRWAGTGRILISIASTVPYFDDEAQMTRLIAYDLTTQKANFLGRKTQGLEGDDVLFVDPAGAYLLMQIQKTIYDWPSVYRVDIATSAMQEIVKPTMPIWEWFADSAGVVRAGMGFSERTWSLIYRKSADEKFRRVGKARYDDEEANMDLLRFNRESDEGYIMSNKDTGRFALYRYNYATRTRGELVFADPRYDLSDVDLNDEGSAVEAVRYVDDQDRVIWFEPEMKKHQAEIDAALKGRQSRLVNRSLDGKKMLFWIGSPSDPGYYYLYNIDEGVLRRVAYVNKDLPADRLSATRAVEYAARDGLTISAYLTLPRGKPAKDLPLIILPHGGPYDVRDKLAFDPEVQFLANRGYAVFQPNFRGSGGYGKQFYEKGEGQIGRAMQDDLDDGMDWLAKQGTIDPKRVCIVGSSYGGYAALWGVTRNPERYRCAASFAGVTDFNRQLKYSLTYAISKRYRKNWRDTVRGGPGFDLATISPLQQIDKLRIPVMLAHGKEDGTVPYKQSSLYAEALKRAGKNVEFRTYDTEGHGFDDPANMKDWLERLEAFLDKHNPA
jgi:dipeptidyl aminopeptidase/acylaminoacyl peptidase